MKDIKKMFKKSMKEIEVNIDLPAQVTKIEVKIDSFRNKTVSRITDISPCMPIHQRDYSYRNQEVWYPVVDIEIEKNMEAVARFENTGKALYIFNGMFHKEKKELKEKNIILAECIEHWENAFFVEPSTPKMTDFYIIKRFDVKNRFSHVFRLLSETWGGVISIYDISASGEKKLLHSEEITYEHTPKTAFQDFKINKENLLRALNGVIGYTLRAQNKKVDSPTYGGLNLFYDYDAKLFRTSHWVWSWGISIKMFLEALNVNDGLEVGREDLKKAAEIMGNASLKFQISDTDHPASGVVVVREDIWPHKDFHYHGCASHADSMFLAGWGWIPLYRETGDKKYLNSTRKLAEAIEKTNVAFEIIPQDYYITEDGWADHGINESGFGTLGLAEAYASTGDSYYKKIAVEYMDQHLKIYQMENGLWHRFYYHKDQRIGECNYWTRGMGWGMMGLLAMDSILPNEKYIHYAKLMAEQLMKYQHPTGYWAHQFTSTAAETGACEKSTSLWCMLFYKLYQVTKDERHLETARRALQWCMKRQYFGVDSDAYGTLLGCSANSGIVYRNWYNMACSYACAFFGIALMDELKISGN